MEKTFEFDPNKIERVGIEKIKPNSWNPKPENPPEMEKIKRSLEINGYAQPILVRKLDDGYEILDGQHRYLAAKELGYKELYIYNAGEVDDEEAKAMTIWMQTQVSFDDQLLAPLAIELKRLDMELPYSEKEMIKFENMLSFDMNLGETVEDEVPENKENEPTKSKLGEVYSLGRHRLICGDCTDIDTINKLMDGSKADIAFTSPPYNAGLTPSELAAGKTTKYDGKDDSKSESEYSSFLNAYLRCAMSVSEYVFMNIQSLSGNKRSLIEVLYDNRDIYADTIIWDKQHGQPAMGSNILNSVFEYVHVFSKKANRVIGTLNFRGTIDNILHLPPQRSNEYSDTHNATFSVEFASWFVSRFAKESVLDSFGGTGTTLIACEQLGKKCFMCELDPAYCDIIRRRYWKFTHDGDETGWEEGTLTKGKNETREF